MLFGLRLDIDGGWACNAGVSAFQGVVSAVEGFDQPFGEAPLVTVFRAYFCGWGEGAESGIGDDLFDLDDIATGLIDTGEVERGDLEAVEEKAGAFGVDLVGGDAAEDVADGALDGSAVVGIGEVEVEGVLRLVPSRGVLGGAAGGVVVVTKFFAAEAWAAATVSVGEDVAALEALGGV